MMDRKVVRPTIKRYSQHRGFIPRRRGWSYRREGEWDREMNTPVDGASLMLTGVALFSLCYMLYKIWWSW